jgi:hypothetical protein
MQSLVTHVQMVASQPSTKFKLLIGHGTLTGQLERLPADTYIIFLSKPGHSLAGQTILSNPQMFRRDYIKNVITGAIPQGAIEPIRLRMWKQHVYGPASYYPDMNIDLFDRNSRGTRTPGTAFNNVFGVHTLNSSGRRIVHFKGTSANLSNLVRFGGKGIYVVASCRASIHRTPGAVGAALRNIRLTGGNKTTLRRMGTTDPIANRLAQAVENTQARLTQYKRKKTNSPNSRPRKKARTSLFTFAPGRPASTPRKRTATTTTRRPRRNGNTVMRNV